jgi:predicted DsbA family dithiol-disulfide isomerase
VAATAAECAGDQGQFWPMHHVLFERMELWSTSDDVDTALTRLAAGLGLDGSKFTACLTSRDALERVLRDLFDGQAIGVRHVPAFVLLHGETPFVFAGARSTEQFASVLQRQLQRLKTGN